MEVETTLPETAAQPGPESQPGSPTDGLAAAIAAEHGAGPGENRVETPAGGPGSGKRPGRPPVHGRYSKAAGSDGKHLAALPGEILPPIAGEIFQPAEMESPGEISVVIPPDLLSQIVSETLGLGENFAAYKLEAIASKAALTSDEIRPQLDRTRIGDKRKEIIGELTPLALQEWGLDPKLSPTAAIGLMLGPWVLASVSAYFTLASLAAERLALDKANGKEKA